MGRRPKSVGEIAAELNREFGLSKPRRSPRSSPADEYPGDHVHGPIEDTRPTPVYERGDADDSMPKPRTTSSASGSRSAPEMIDRGISLAELMACDLPAPVFVVEGLLPTGLSILAARPKIGKSWLVYQVAMAVPEGRPCLGDRAVRQGPVLYLAMEDTRRRLRDRAEKILSGTGWPASSRLDLRVSWPRAGAGGLQRLGEWMADHKGGLVIVDTLAKFRDPTTGRGGGYEADYAAVASLKALADAHDVGVLVVHHTRKSVAPGDPFDEVSGTLGINGAADSIMVLDRPRGEGSAAMYVTGRDIAEQTISLSMDQDTGVWRVTGRTDGIERIEAAKPANKVDRCASWLRDFLGAYAWPDSEVMTAAATAGFTTDNVKVAKARLRKEEPPLSSRTNMSGGVWWNWIGPKSDRKPDRPREMAPETPHTGRASYENPGKQTDSSADQSRGSVQGPTPDTPRTGASPAPDTGQSRESRDQSRDQSRGLLNCSWKSQQLPD